MKFLTFLLAGVICFGCTSKSVTSETTPSDSLKTSATGFDENNFESYLNLDNYQATGADTSDIQLIDSTCAVVINPTEDQIQRMEKEYGDDFETIADDYSFYQSEAILKFDSANIRIVNVASRLVKFRGRSGTWFLDVRKEGAPEWNIIFFNIDKKPVITSAIDVTYEKLDEYYFR